MSHSGSPSEREAAAIREIEMRLTAMKHPRRSTDDEIEQAIRKLGFNPKTVTVKGLCTSIYVDFYKTQKDIPKRLRNPNEDCYRDSVFGQACSYLGLITEPDSQDYLRYRSGGLTSINYQPVRLAEVVDYLFNRDQLRALRQIAQAEAIASKQSRRKAAAASNKRSRQRTVTDTAACGKSNSTVCNVDNDTDFHWDLERMFEKYGVTGSCPLERLFNLIALPESHPE